MTKELIKILYEDKNLLAINKPAGLVVHEASHQLSATSHQPTVADWIIKNYPKIKKVGEDPSRPGIVHRLDKDTSGVLIIAKNQEAFEFLKKQFSAHSVRMGETSPEAGPREIKKEYLALISGHLKKDWGIIDLPIGKSKTDFRKKSTHVGKLSGKVREAKTEYRLLERFDKYDLVLVSPKTGRTHQIRVHMRALNHPVVCDKLYGFSGSVCPEGLTRHFLHAKSIELGLINGESLKIEAKLPKDLEGALKRLRREVGVPTRSSGLRSK